MVPTLLTCGIAVLAFGDVSIEDYLLAKVFFVLAFLTIVIQIILHLARAHQSQNKRMHYIVAILVCGLCGGLALAAVNYVNRKRDLRLSKATQPTELDSNFTPSPFDRPFISSSLVIDSIKRGKVNFHIQIKNGRIPTQDLRVSFKTKDVSNTEIDSYMPRKLGPDQQLSIPGPPMGVFKKGQYTSLVVQINYKAEIGIRLEDYIHTSRFFVEPDPKPREIHPESSNYEQGVVQDPKGLVQKEVLQGLATPQGTMLFVIPEKTSDGTVNVVRGGNGRRDFVFDPSSRIVAFRITTPNRIVTLIEPLPPATNEKGLYLITLAWDEIHGGFLAVNGKEKRDFDNDPPSTKAQH
jgi:hypothetical protein